MAHQTRNMAHPPFSPICRETFDINLHLLNFILMKIHKDMTPKLRYMVLQSKGTAVCVVCKFVTIVPILHCTEVMCPGYRLDIERQVFG